MERSCKVRIIREATGSRRIATGLEKVEEALSRRGFQIDEVAEEDYNAAGVRDGISSVYVGTRREGGFIRKLEEEKLLLYHTKEPEGEGFYLAFLSGLNLFVAVGCTALWNLRRGFVRRSRKQWRIMIWHTVTRRHSV